MAIKYIICICIKVKQYQMTKSDFPYDQRLSIIKNDKVKYLHTYFSNELCSKEKKIQVSTISITIKTVFISLIACTLFIHC